MRYIDADALLSRLPDDLPYKASVKRVLTQAHTADVVEVRHGEWIKHSAWYECSVCKGDFFVEGYAEDYDPISDWDLHFCPNCGAKMDGERRSE
jgi:hypothetical protein